MKGWRAAPILLCGCMIVAACSHSEQARPVASPRVAVPQLASGGRNIFPTHFVVAFYGAPGVPAMGVLGEGSPSAIIGKLRAQARRYETDGKKVIPAFELVATVARRAPGPLGNYSASTDEATLNRYLQAARQMNGLLILDIQPGRAEFLPEVRRYEKLLSQPDVSLALDPEWKMASDQIPAEQIGHTTAQVVNQVSAYLAGIVKRHNLPQKLLVIHEFTSDMVEGKQNVLPRAGLAITFHVDGFGSRAAKLSKYRLLSKRVRERFVGFKLFYRQDVDMLSPSDVLNLTPRPDLVTYQ